MVRKDFWRSDWFLGVIVAVAVFLLSGTDLIKSLEREADDLGARASSERVAVTDRKLADSFGRAGNVLLPILFREGQRFGKPDKQLADFVRKHAISTPQDNGAPPIPTASVDLHIARALPTATLPANMMLKIANEQSAVDVSL